MILSLSPDDRLSIIKDFIVLIFRRIPLSKFKVLNTKLSICQENIHPSSALESRPLRTKKKLTVLIALSKKRNKKDLLKASKSFAPACLLSWLRTPTTPLGCSLHEFKSLPSKGKKKKKKNTFKVLRSQGKHPLPFPPLETKGPFLSD